jgi:xanthine dehydrogenase accessory factor
VRGGGELASTSARLLFLAGLRVVVLERERPLAVRRLVCFAEAVRHGEATIEGVRGERALASGVPALLDAFRAIPVVVDPDARLIASLRPDAVVDARMAKSVLDTRRGDAPLVIGLGPGFVAGRDVHAVVETQRGPDLGRVIRSGSAEADSGRPAPVGGVAEERVLRAPCGGVFLGSAKIGDVVASGATVGEVAGEPVVARTAGLLRGLIDDGVEVAAGTKLGDVDPRGRAVDPARISDKARAVAAGVLEAVGVGLALRVEATALASGRERR